ncbi:hypothetical protein G4G27_15810 [Sphingomonas sp. So64.6b]|uniref:sensor histidine kinase n=1 Tax=Sphingomonas sp. So64.6b TaxID=2997354 RepID=UPI0016007001|nr:histidine kinase [Sphingomonas sp. So64.6b]QNA85296.1 hypothetical protein G4G27_15810 [Sphingomonas sp. So64.6b]
MTRAPTEGAPAAIDTTVDTRRSRGPWLSPRGRSILWLTAAFWIFTFSMLSIRAAAMSDLPFDVLGPRRLLTAAFGAMLCFGMVRLLDGLRMRSFEQFVIWGTVGALTMAVALTAFSTLLNRVIVPIPEMAPFQLGERIQWVLIWLGYCLAWTGTYLALTYHWEVQDQQARISEMAKLAQEAQIATLRYQVNPHFLFNTLNSISSLVLEHRNADAELMLLNLSAFVRSTFIQDPQTMIPLREEIGLQRLYLQIEEVRFSERLKVVIDIPDALLDMRLPALILQPLVENALRHGVERSEELTIVAIHAMLCGNELRITVEDDSAGAAPNSAGSGLGLRNVGDRLRAHFGDRATLTAMPREQGGFRSEIRLPLEKLG